jgi:hypothetical protein
MPVRTFDAGFTKQVSKKFDKGTISIYSSEWKAERERDKGCL